MFLLWVVAYASVGVVAEEAQEAEVSIDVQEGDKTDALGLSESERAEVDKGSETIEFQAEVSRLMDIIINSLYQNREIFLRELISNAADAIDKVRFTALTNKNILSEDEELDVQIKFDKDSKTITITDKGIGMTKEHLKKNLGVVAKSGTTDFIDAAATGGDDNLSLIGQFGVGFYSVYLVADKVTVVSKHPEDEQYIWESTANSVFSVSKDPRGNTLGRGTSIILQLKEDAEEFLNENELEKIVTRYSQFINFPIKLETTRVETKEVPDPDAKEEESKEEEDEDLAVTDDEEESPKQKMKEVKETIVEWKTLNAAKALWTRDPKEITDDEYDEFYKTLNPSGAAAGALEKVHFVAEGEITFKALLYIPEKADSNQYSEIFNMKASGVKLYVRRVLIADEFEDLLPRYLSFVKGVVDSDDLPLNVSRETLAQNRVLKVMGKKLARKVLDLLRKLSQAADEAETAAASEEKEGGPEDVEEINDAALTYEKFWNEHGRAIKFGVVDDRKNKGKLVKLLRYQTSSSDGKFVSLETYVDRMKEDQKFIYYITGESMEKVQNSPFLEKVTKKGYEVLFMTEPMDEYVTQSMTEFDGIELASVTKDGLKLGDDDKKSLKKLKEEFKPLTVWLKETYGDRVEKVQVTNRLTTTPCAVVTGQYGWSSNLQRVMKGSTLGGSSPNHMAGKKILEINPRHPIVQSLKAKTEEDDENESLKDLALLLLDSASMQAGFSVEEYSDFSGRMNRVVSAGLDLDPDADVPQEPEDDPTEEEEEAPEEEEEVEEAQDGGEAPAHEEL